VRGLVTGLAPAGDDAGLVTLAWTIVNQHDQTVVRARVDVVWRREAPVAPEPFQPAENGFVPIPL
jgi:hypothetical protein